MYKVEWFVGTTKASCYVDSIIMVIEQLAHRGYMVTKDGKPVVWNSKYYEYEIKYKERWGV